MDGKTQQLLDRTFHFGIGVLKSLKKLPDDSIYRVPKNQLAGSATSIGSNYEEAHRAVSRRDFTNKIGISYKESQTHYWLKVLSPLYDEQHCQKASGIFLNESQERRNIFSHSENLHVKNDFY